ncbi:MAG: hypothetical protein IPJ71_19370 [Bdellovibrionales bacterium]|nr:hypothetical protein [Bdellovibrionales bacterium]
MKNIRAVILRPVKYRQVSRHLDLSTASVLYSCEKALLFELIVISYRFD